MSRTQRHSEFRLYKFFLYLKVDFFYTLKFKNLFIHVGSSSELESLIGADSVLQRYEINIQLCMCVESYG